MTVYKLFDSIMAAPSLLFNTTSNCEMASGSFSHFLNYSFLNMQPWAMRPLGLFSSSTQMHWPGHIIKPPLNFSPPLSRKQSLG